MAMELEGIAQTATVVVGIDFGTTFSTVAWAPATATVEQANIVDNWPICLANDSEKIDFRCVPSELTYVPAGACSEVVWGFQLTQDMGRYKWFKLGLNAQGDSSSFSRSYFIGRDPPHAPMDIQGLVVDFLRKLRLHVEAQLPELTPPSSVLYVIGVPTAWTSAALTKTEDCAFKAGIPRSGIRVVREPHAAAMHIFETLETSVAPGSTFVLCDAGGGTTDVISFRFQGRNLHAVLEPAGSSTGGQYGSVNLDMNFQKFLEKKLYGAAGWNAKIRDFAVRWWECTAKRTFSGVGEKGVDVPLAGMSDNAVLGIRNGVMHMSDAEVRSLFKPVVDNIINLVKNQIDKTDGEVSAVILVGGFGENPFLYNSLKFEVGFQRIVEILSVPNAWTTVARGALLDGLANPLLLPTKRRVAREIYGVKVTIPWDIKDHDDDIGFWDPYSGDYCVEVIQWFLKKGEPTSELPPIQSSTYPVYDGDDSRPEAISIAIYVCDSTEPPLYEDGKSVILLVTLRSRLSIIPKMSLGTLPGKGKDDTNHYWVMDYAIRCTFRETSYEFVIEYDGDPDEDSKVIFMSG